MDARVQTPRPDDPADATIADLFHELMDEGRNLVSAEINLYKQIAAYRASKAKNGLVAIVAVIFLLNAALVAFFVGLVFGLADLIGPVAAGFVVLAVTGGISFLIVRSAAGKLAALSGDKDEKAALKAGEQRA